MHRHVYFIYLVWWCSYSSLVAKTCLFCSWIRNGYFLSNSYLGLTTISWKLWARCLSIQKLGKEPEIALYADYNFNSPTPTLFPGEACVPWCHYFIFVSWKVKSCFSASISSSLYHMDLSTILDALRCYKNLRGGLEIKI
jgi:hypothetical protein